MIKKNGGIFGRNPTYNDVVVEGVLTLKEAQVFDNDITINGDLTVNGTETVINTVELNVDDKNITMGAVVAKVGLAATTNITAGQFTVQLADTSGLIPGMTVTKTAGTGAFGASPKIASVDSHTQITLTVAHATSGTIIFDTGGATDDTADGGGITLKGTTDKFIKWVKANVAWVFSDPIKAPDVTVDNLTASLPVFTDANKTLITQSQQNALNAIAGAVTAARFLRGDGTNVSMAAIQASDVPTLNQSTTGNASTATTANNLKSNATTGLMQVVGPAAGTTRVMTVPDADFSAARKDAAQTFTGDQTFSNNLIVSGLAGIGEASPTYKLDVKGPYDTLPARILRYATYGEVLRFGRSGVSESASISYPGDQTFAINTANVERLRVIDDVTVKTGNLVIGTSGNGIDFSATADGSGTMTSELLDDYEEGTWTPTPSGVTVNSGTPVYSGNYTKVGRLVTVNWYMSGGNITTVAGTSKFTNLPFANSAGYSHGIFMNELTYASGPMESGPSTNVQLLAAITGSYMGGTVTYMAAT